MAVTRPTDVPVSDFLASVEHPTRRADAEVLLGLFSRVTGAPAVMWGPSIVGFGRTPIRYADGSPRDWMTTGFSPRRSSLVLYIMDGFEGYDAQLAQLGKHRTGRSCLYVNKLADVDLSVLERLVAASVAEKRARAANP